MSRSQREEHKETYKEKNYHTVE